MTRPGWRPAEVPPLHGLRAFVTGATSPVGTHVAEALARAGAEVALAGRDRERLATTGEQLAALAPASRLHRVELDLADPASVRGAAQAVAALGPLAILVNNAAVTGGPRERSADGFESQMGTNHLGHFALTGLLLPQLVASGRGRVVTVSSLIARAARRVATSNLGSPGQNDRDHSGRWTAYASSRLANLLFTVELDRRARNRQLPLCAVAAHPGYTTSDLASSDGDRAGRRPHRAILTAVTRLVGQSAEAGARPVVVAATAPDLRGGSYVGPAGPFELHGEPGLVPMPEPALDPERAAELWVASEQATGVAFP